MSYITEISVTALAITLAVVGDQNIDIYAKCSRTAAAIQKQGKGDVNVLVPEFVQALGKGDCAMGHSEAVFRDVKFPVQYNHNGKEVTIHGMETLKRVVEAEQRIIEGEKAFQSALAK